MRAADLTFDLPRDRIATTPADPRDASKLLVCSRTDTGLIQHRTFRDLPHFLRPNDTLVFNRSAVLPARIQGRRDDTKGRIDGLFLNTQSARWTVLLRSNGKLHPGTTITLDHPPAGPAADPTPPTHTLTLIEKRDDAWLADLRTDGRPALDDNAALAALHEVGSTPLPPYIESARKAAHLTVPDTRDRDRYQTVYADPNAPGSVAAPTAGLHFTPELLDTLKRRSVQLEHVLLHVGSGTFKTIDEHAHLDHHRMHAEFAAAPAGPLNRIDAVQPPARRVLVGTTTVRTLESIHRPLTPELRSRGYTAHTDLFIKPPFTFRWTDALITNFHLPRSTLLALVAAFLDTPANNGLTRLLGLYKLAIDHRYRFFSYGDAMLILP